jgi:hypothetical protein
MKIVQIISFENGEHHSLISGAFGLCPRLPHQILGLTKILAKESCTLSLPTAGEKMNYIGLGELG